MRSRRSAGRTNSTTTGGAGCSDNKIVLMRPPTVDECFRLPEDRDLSTAWSRPELAGRASIASLGLADKVRMIEQPVALTTFHVLSLQVASARAHHPVLCEQLAREAARERRV